MIGSALEGRYRIEAELGSGGVGAVYRGVHVALNRAVAIKVLRSEYASSPEQRQRFEREARALAAMSHPNIVAVTDFGVAGDVAYIVMDLLEGETLAQRIKREGPLPLSYALVVLRQLLRALSFVHAQGLVHRDVKPPNVFLQTKPDGEIHVRLLDFGLAKFLVKDPNTKNLTRAGQIFGTPSYMAPEQVAGQESDARTDVYAAGIVFFEMLAGRAPFKGTAAEIFRQHLMEDLPLESLVPKAARSKDLDALLLKATAKTQKDRYADGADMLAAVEAFAVANAAHAATVPHVESVGAVLSTPEAAPAPDAEASVQTSASLPTEEVSAGAIESSYIEDISAAEIDSLPDASPPRSSRSGPVFRALAGVALAVSLSSLGFAAYAVHVYTAPGKAEQRGALDRFLGLAPPTVPACPPTSRCLPPQASSEAPREGSKRPQLPDTTLREEAAKVAPAPVPAPPGPSATPSAAAPEPAPPASPSAPEGPVKGPAPNPWATTPRELSSLVSKVNRGKNLEKKEMLRVHEFNAKRPDDPRGHLLLARAYTNRHWYKDAVNEYAIALKVSDNARGDPRMLTDLVRIVQFGSAEAERLVRETYGDLARPTVDKAILSVSANPEAKSRLEKLRAEL